MAPFVQYVVRITGFGEADNSCRSVDLGIYRLGSDQFADVLLRLILRKIQQLCEATHLNASVVLGNDTHIVLNNTLAQILPSLMSFLIAGLSRLSVEDIGAAQMGAKLLGNLGPSHQLMNRKQTQKLRIQCDLRVPGILVNAVQKVVLLVIIRCKYDKVNDALEDLI